MDDLLRHLDVKGVEVAYHEGSLQLNVSIKIAAEIGYAYAKEPKNLLPRVYPKNPQSAMLN
jgi:hypothetical protein